MGIDIREKHWPRIHNVLTRALNVLKTTLLSDGISIVYTHGRTRLVAIEKISSPKDTPEPQLTTKSLPICDDATMATILI